MKLNLGCGRFPMEGYVNVDGAPAVRPDVLHDLNVFPYPFPPGSAEEVHASHVLEHLADPFAAVAEWARLLAPAGRMIVRVPHFSRGFTHPDHKRGFDVSFPLYFDPAFEGGFTGTHLVCDSLRLRWFAQPWLKKRALGPWEYRFGATFGTLVDFLAALSPFAASRLWGFFVGGFEEVEFRFHKPAAPSAPPGAA